LVLPAMPATYTNPRSLQDMVDFIVGRVCDQLGIPHQLLKRWSEPELNSLEPGSTKSRD